MHKPGKTRSRTGCRTCRIRKVKCDEEKVPSQGHEEPQCRRCLAARILCEWKGGPIPRRSHRTSTERFSPREVAERDETPNASQSKPARKQLHLQVTPPSPGSLSIRSPASGAQSRVIQAANSLSLSGFDRQCLGYLQDSILVVILGKHWPWSTVSYAYHKVATREPMVMSMILASAAREIHRSRLYDSEHSYDQLMSNEQSDMDGRVHYGRALSGLREALKQEVKSPRHIEAIFITLWLMIDYENRFGSGASAINIHIRGIETLLHNHIVPLLQGQTRPPTITAEGQDPLQNTQPRLDVAGLDDTASNTHLSAPSPAHGLGGTCVPLFLLWTLYFFTPAALFFGSETARLDTDIFRFFLRSEAGNTPLSLPYLYRLSRQSPARFWGEEYPMSSQLDDLENLSGLTLYHRSHVIQFKITEMFKQSSTSEISFGEGSPYQRIIKEINTLSIEYDTLLTSARRSNTCDVAGDRRIMETVFWSAITYYGTIVYFHLCFQDLVNDWSGIQDYNTIIPLNTAVLQVLELGLKLHRSRPRLVVRIVWPLFIAGIATSDQIYQDWVSIRLRELGKYGQNYDRIFRRFDEIIQGNQPIPREKRGHYYLGC